MASALREQAQIQVVTLPRSTQRTQPSAAFRRLRAHLRQVIETVNSQLALQFHVEINHAHTFWGLTVRLYTKPTAHTRCVWINRLLGVPDVLHIKTLAFPSI